MAAVALRCVWHCVLWVLLTGGAITRADDGGAVSAATTAARERVQTAAEIVRADPNLAGMETTRTLRFKKHKEEEKRANSPSPWLRWWRNLFQSIAEGARVLVWFLGAALVAFVLVRLSAWLRLHGNPPLHGDVPAQRPSHVGMLDIRPKSLPADIGGAAAVLWQRGQQRAALSLLYRGALSRLVHGYGLPIGVASTEGECLRLAQAGLPLANAEFFSRLVLAWENAAYAGRLVPSTAALALCEGFAQHLQTAPQQESGQA